jgi:membrane-associated phospholipid phosphatase
MDRRTKALLAAAGGCAVLFVLLLAGAYSWGPGESLDQYGMSGFVNANHAGIEGLTGRFLRLGNPQHVALITALLAAVALARGRPRIALAIVALVGATSFSSQVLKAVLAHPRYAPVLGHAVGPDAFPSGHATAAMSLALAGVLAAPRRARLAAALAGSLLALAVGGSAVAWGWHYPSDVIGGYLLATGWALALTAALYEADRRFPASERWAASTFARVSERAAASGFSAAAAASALTVALLSTALLLVVPRHTLYLAREHTAFVFVAAAVASAALALPAAMAGLMRR